MTMSLPCSHAVSSPSIIEPYISEQRAQAAGTTGTALVKKLPARMSSGQRWADDASFSIKGRNRNQVVTKRNTSARSFATISLAFSS